VVVSPDAGGAKRLVLLPHFHTALLIFCSPSYKGGGEWEGGCGSNKKRTRC
jgi:hypothetical protein